MRRALFLLALLVSLLSSSCARLNPEEDPSRQARIECANPKLETAFYFHDQAKDLLASYYKTRKENELFYAWYASEDSMYMARTISKCTDKKNKHYHAVQNIMKKNRILRELIVQNMRIDSQALVSELFLEEYQRIFVRDIR